MLYNSVNRCFAYFPQWCCLQILNKCLLKNYKQLFHNSYEMEKAKCLSTWGTENEMVEHIHVVQSSFKEKWKH